VEAGAGGAWRTALQNGAGKTMAPLRSCHDALLDKAAILTQFPNLPVKQA
jgi:hypothetical protein